MRGVGHRASSMVSDFCIIWTTPVIVVCKYPFVFKAIAVLLEGHPQCESIEYGSNASSNGNRSCPILQ